MAYVYKMTTKYIANREVLLVIKPKHSFRKKSFQITEKFTDRIEAKALYKSKLLYNSRDYNVLMFYGVSGVGKSTLRKEICRMHCEENKKDIYMYLDVNYADVRNMENGLLKLVDSCSAKVNFKSFELAYALYYKKKYPNNQYGRGKDSIFDSDTARIGLNIVSIIDSGITSVSVEVIEKVIQKIFQETIDKAVKEELKRFVEYSLEEIEERLPLFFQYDLECYCKKHPQAKILIVFDTFEALSANNLEQIHRSRNERWVQEIIAYFPRKLFPMLLVTILGRDKIQWGEPWDELIEQHELREFTQEFAHEYLQDAGVSGEDVIVAIVENSRGLPLLLYLMAETYINIKNKGEQPFPEDFEGSYPQIIERFIYNLDANTVDLLRMLAIPNFYNMDILRIAEKENNTSCSYTRYQQFNKYSFVTLDENEKDYYMHDLLRQEILQNTDDTLKLRINFKLRQYYQEQLIVGSDKKAFIEMFYHACEEFSKESFDKWLHEPISAKNTDSPLEFICQMQLRGEQDVLLQVIERIIIKYGLEALDLRLVNVYIDIIHLSGAYEAAVKICEQYLERLSSKEKKKSEQLMHMQVRQLHHRMFYVPVNILIEAAMKMLNTVKVKKYPKVYNELLFLIGGNLGVLSGDFDFAEKWLSRSLNYARQHNLETFIHRTVRKQADLLLHKGEIEVALELVNTYIPDSEPIDSRYKIYLMGIKGEIYRKRGDLEEAYSCFEIINQKSLENNLPGWRSHSHLGMGMVEAMRGNGVKAEEHFEKADVIYKKIKQEWGEINTQAARLFLAQCRKKPIQQSMLETCQSKALNMQYQYNVSFLEEVANGKSPYLQLFFL